MSVEKQPLPDAAVRAELVERLDTSFAVEAGAGTGKTTLIVRRIVAHVLRGDPIDSIVAITFTKKAAAELRVRVRNALEEIVAANEAALKAAAAAALRRIDSAPIQTFHSFCDSLLREHPVEAAIDPLAKTLEEAKNGPLFVEVFEDAIAASENDDDLSELFAAGVQRADLERFAHALIRVRDLEIAEPEAPELPSLQRFIEAALSKAEVAASIARVSCKDPMDKLAEAISERVDFFESLRQLEPSAQERALFRGCGRARRTNLGAAKNWRKEAKEEAHERILAIDDELADLRIAIRRRRARSAFRFARLAAEIYERKKTRDGVLDFEDQLLRARNLVRDHVDVRSRIAARYTTLIVDEFQDTDPLQAEIAFFLAEDPGSKSRAKRWDAVTVGAGRLVVVGDPKQSIYRFRRADIEIYEFAKQRIVESGGEFRKIQVNFRSEASILAFVNARFSELIAPHSTIPRIQPEYVPLLASPENAAREEEHGGRRRVVVLADEGELAAEGVGDMREHEFSAIAAYLASLLRGPKAFMVRDSKTKQDRAARLSDIAILFRSSTDIELLEDALKNESLPYRLYGGKRFYRRVEVRTAIALFRALDDATDEVALLATLRGVLFAIPDDELATFVATGGSFENPFTTGTPSPRLRAALEILGALRKRRHAGSLPSFVEEALAATRAYEIFLLFREGTQRAANLDKIVAVARAFEGGSGTTFRQFVAEIDRMAASAEREPEAEYQDESDDTIALLTMHSSKGLEWPIVVLANLAGQPPTRPVPIVTRGAENRLEFVKGSAGERVLETARYEEAELGEIAREECERRRLLYVATTRARDLLVLPRYLLGKKTKEKDADASGEGDAKDDERSHGTSKRAPLIADLLPDPLYSKTGEGAPYGIRVDAGALPRSEPSESPFRLSLDLDAALPEAAKRALADRDSFASRVRERLAATRVGRPVRSATTEKAARAREEEGDEGDGVPASNRGVHAPGDLRGAEFGSFVHRVFERLDLLREGDLALPSKAVSSALARECGVAVTAVPEAERIARAFLASPLAAELRLAKRLHREVPFAFASGGVLYEGAIDLLVEFGDGRTWIVDWKTDDVAGDALDVRLQDYEPQGELYRRAVETVSGRPVERVCFHFLRSGTSRDL